MTPQLFHNAPARRISAIAILGAFLLTGCASLDTRVARESVRQTVLDRAGQDFTRLPPRPQAGPVPVPSADAAVGLALGDGTALSAILAQLDGDEARALQSSLLKNPFIHAAWLYPRDGAGSILDAGLSWDLLGLLTLDARRDAADQARSAARLGAGARILELAARARSAWYAHLADREGAALLADQVEAADLGAEIAQRLERAGNLPPLAAASARASRLESRFARDEAELAARASGERLAALLALDDPARLVLPENLPRLPEADPPPLDSAALEAADLGLAGLRADLARIRKQMTSEALPSWIGSLEVGWGWERESSGEWQDGPALGLSLPLFDTGQARRAAIRSDAAVLEARLAERRLALAREAREARQRMTRARARVEALREELLPLLGEAADQALLQYNAMQKSPFQLLDLKQRELDAIRRLVQGLADYWQARTALEALAMGISLEAGPAVNAPAVARPAASQSGGH